MGAEPARIDADLAFEVTDGRGRTTSGRVAAAGLQVRVDVGDPVALFAALPGRLEGRLADAAGAALAPAPVVELRAGGRLLAVLDPDSSSPLGRLLGDRRLRLTPRGLLAAARGRSTPRGVVTGVVAACVAVLAVRLRRASPPRRRG